MSNSDVPPENGSAENDVESPVDGPTPDWMKMATSASSGPSLTEEDTPDWLKDIKSGKGTGPLKENPAAEADDASDEMSDLERLLAEEGIDLDSVPEERPEGAEGMSARDFMISTSDDEMIRKKVGAEPITEESAPPTQELEETSPTPTPAPAKADDASDEMSDLERLLAEEGIDLGSVPEERPEGAEGMSARDFMISTSDDEMIRKKVGAEPITEESPTPPSQPGQEPPPSPEPESAPATAEPDEDLPDWLSEEDEDEPAPAAEPEPVAAEPMMGMAADDDDDDKMVVEDDLPDWLQDDDDEAPPAPESISETVEPAEDKLVADDDLPDWLSSDEDESFEDEEGDEDLPAWLSDIEEDDEESPPQAEIASTPAAPVADEDDIDVEDDELPDWLKEAQEDETTLEPTPSPMMDEVAATLDTDESVISDEDLPDWLQDVQDDDVSQPVLEEDTLSTDDEVSDEDLPDWLSDVQADDSDEPFEPSEPSPLEQGESVDEDLPDWLQDVKDEVLEPDLDFDAAVPTSEPANATSVEADGAGDDKELPDWLQDMEEDTSESVNEEVLPIPEAPSSEPAPVAAADIESESAGERVTEETIEKPVATPQVTAGSGDMPDWLKKLREGEDEEEEAAPQPEPAAVTPTPTPSPAPPQPEAKAAATPEPTPTVAKTEDESKLPGDADERLKLAQSAREKGDIEEAVRYYDSLVSSGAYLDQIIEDMQQAVKSYPSNYLLFQVMGDAMMKDGRLQSALDAYRQALEKLPG